MLARGALDTAGQVSSATTVGHIQELQRRVRPLRSSALVGLDEEITDFLRRAHASETAAT